MDGRDLVALILVGAAYTLISIALGATIMWRLVHVPKLPPPLPVWLSVLYLVVGLLWSAGMLVGGAWLGLVGALLMSALFGQQVVASLRNRAGGRP